MALAEVLFGIDEVLLIPVGAEDFRSCFVQAQCAVGVIAEVMGENDTQRTAVGDFAEMVGGPAGAGVDEHGAGWAADGVYRAAIAEEKEIVAQFFPVHNSIHSYD